MRKFSIIRMLWSAFVKSKQHVILEKLLDGKVIDIGGGGEGIIGKAGGNRVFAIDQFLSEIHEAKRNALDVSWLVADGVNIPFENNSFEQASAFFSCMYMNDEVKRKVFTEVRRVLKKGGEFWIWDARMHGVQKEYAISIKVEFQNKHILNTIYGVKAKEQTTDTICSLLHEVGFQTKISENQKHWFMIKAF